MSIQERVMDKLSSYSALTDLVDQRISAGISKQGELNPRVRFFCFGGRPEQTQDGEQDLRDFVLQVDAIADDYDAAWAVARAVIAALKLTESPLTNVYVAIENDGYDIPEPENHEHRVMVEARIWHVPV